MYLTTAEVIERSGASARYFRELVAEGFIAPMEPGKPGRGKASLFSEMAPCRVCLIRQLEKREARLWLGTVADENYLADDLLPGLLFVRRAAPVAIEEARASGLKHIERYRAALGANPAQTAERLLVKHEVFGGPIDTLLRASVGDPALQTETSWSESLGSVVRESVELIDGRARRVMKEVPITPLDELKDHLPRDVAPVIDPAFAANMTRGMDPAHLEATFRQARPVALRIGALICRASFNEAWFPENRGHNLLALWVMHVCEVQRMVAGLARAWPEAWSTIESLLPFFEASESDMERVYQHVKRRPGRPSAGIVPQLDKFIPELLGALRAGAFAVPPEWQQGLLDELENIQGVAREDEKDSGRAPLKS